ncbi:MAG: hypothetical protein P8X51_09665 [Maritimibacter sp.]
MRGPGNPAPFGGAFQAGIVGPVSRFDVQPAEIGHDHPRQHHRIGVWGQMACRHGLFQPVRQLGNPFGPFLLQKRPHLGVSAAEQPGAEHDQTAPLRAARNQFINRGKKHFQQSFTRVVYIVESRPDRSEFGLDIKLDRLAKQFLFRPECGVNTGRYDPHHLDQLRDRCAVIAIGPEHFHRLSQSFVAVKFPRPAPTWKWFDFIHKSFPFVQKLAVLQEQYTRPVMNGKIEIFARFQSGFNSSRPCPGPPRASCNHVRAAL